VRQETQATTIGDSAMQTPAGYFKERLLGYAKRLRFPRLLAATATLFVIDLVVPDIIPFADEVLLGLVTMVLASLKQRRRDSVATPAAAPDRERLPGPA
jgi:hypothetical protein